MSKNTEAIIWLYVKKHRSYSSYKYSRPILIKLSSKLKTYQFSDRSYGSYMIYRPIMIKLNLKFRTKFDFDKIKFEIQN